MSQNDPHSDGNDKNNKADGPPDLEDVWRDLNRRLNSVFGRKSSGDNNGSHPKGGSGNGRVFGGGLGLIVAIVATLWLASGVYIVDASEKAVVLQFGKFKEEVGNGLQWRLPYPIQTHEIVNVTQLRTVEVGFRGNEAAQELREALMLTDDENIINIQFAVQYTISNPQDFLFNNRNAEDSVKQSAETSMREVVGRRKMNSVLYEDRAAVANEVETLMQSILDRYKTGIRVNRVALQNTQPPKQVQAAFNDAVEAGQDLERQRNEGQAYANDVLGKIQGLVSRLQAEAEGYKMRVVSQAEGDASRFKQVMAEYAKAPEVTRNRMYLDTMQDIFSNTTKIMVDTHGNGNLLYLPLDKLMQQISTTSPTNSTTSAAAHPSDAASSRPTAGNPSPVRSSDVSAAVDYRDRDAMRSKEKGVR